MSLIAAIKTDFQNGLLSERMTFGTLDKVYSLVLSKIDVLACRTPEFEVLGVLLIPRNCHIFYAIYFEIKVKNQH